MKDRVDPKNRSNLIEDDSIANSRECYDDNPNLLPKFDLESALGNRTPTSVVHLGLFGSAEPWPCPTCQRYLLPTPGIAAILARIHVLAHSNCPVNIIGESGVGKEAIARLIHEHSPRAAGPFVTMNCGSIPESLIQGELLGSTKGAYTGAQEDRHGVFERADGGTVFLDEIADLPPLGQQALLRVLQQSEVQRLGHARSKAISVRLVTATHQDLALAIERGRLRPDFVHRASGVRIVVPPLRCRPNDIPLLVAHFAELYAQRDGRSLRGITVRAMRQLLEYPWPGNVRELEHTIEVAVALLGNRDVIDLDDLTIAATTNPSSPPVSSTRSRPPSRTTRSKPGPRSKYQLDWATIYEQVHAKGIGLREIWRALPNIGISYPWFCASFSKFVAQYETTE